MPQRLIDGDAVRCMREKEGWPQHKLAAALGISPQFLCDIEKGRKDGTPALLRKFAETFNCRQSMLERKRDVA